MKRAAPIFAAIVGIVSLVFGIFDATYRELTIAGAILLAGALLAGSASRSA